MRIRVVSFVVMIVGMVMLGIVSYVIQAPTILGKTLAIVGSISAFSGFFVWQFSDKLAQ